MASVKGKQLTIGKEVTLIQEVEADPNVPISI
jgi:hypothetical protein